MSTSAMTAGQVADQVRARHRQPLADLHHALFTDRGEQSDRGMTLRLDGPSVTDRGVVVTALISVLPGTADQAATPGTATVQVTVRGHQRSLGTSARLPAVEEEGWARALLGPQWEALAYRQGMVASFGGQLGATGFVLYLGPDGVATEAPPGAGERLYRLGPP